jgi:hypothetical protein
MKIQATLAGSSPFEHTAAIKKRHVLGVITRGEEYTVDDKGSSVGTAIVHHQIIIDK